MKYVASIIILFSINLSDEFSLAFDGHDDYVSLPNPTFNSSQGVSLELIFKWDGENVHSNSMYLLLFARDGNGNAYLKINNDGMLTGQLLQYNSESDNDHTLSASIDQDVWYHAVYTYDT